MANVDWDLFSIVRSCKATSLSPSSTIFETSPPLHSSYETSPQSPTNTTTLQNYTDSYFDDFTLSHENNSILFSPLKTNDFLPIENFNPTPITPAITTTTIFTTPTINNINTSINGTNHYPTVLDFPIFVGEKQIKPNHNNQMLFPKPAAYVEITTEHFDLAYNHPSVLHELQRERNKLSTQAPQTSFRVIPNTLSQYSKRKSWKKKNNNTKILECHLSVDKIKEDPWTWRKYGEKIIKGSSHPRSYYRCSSFNDCSAKKLVEKSKNKENTYIVTYKGHHNHKEPKCIDKSLIGTSKNKPSKRVLSTAKVVESSSNVRSMGSPNVVMAQSKVLYPENELATNRLLVSQETVENVMKLQFDEPKSDDAQVFTCESIIPYSPTKSIGSCGDDHDILIPNMRAMSEDILLDFNHLNGGRLFP